MIRLGPPQPFIMISNHELHIAADELWEKLRHDYHNSEVPPTEIVLNIYGRVQRLMNEDADVVSLNTEIMHPETHQYEFFTSTTQISIPQIPRNSNFFVFLESMLKPVLEELERQIFETFSDPNRQYIITYDFNIEEIKKYYAKYFQN